MKEIRKKQPQDVQIIYLNENTTIDYLSAYLFAINDHSKFIITDINGLYYAINMFSGTYSYGNRNLKKLVSTLLDKKYKIYSFNSEKEAADNLFLNG